MSRQLRSRLLASFVAFFFVAAGAQAWEVVYGPQTTRDDAFRRVTPVPACGNFAPGYIAVGTQVPAAPGDADVYVVYTTLGGGPGWERTYDVQGLGLADDGMAIVPAPNGYVFLSNTFDGVWNTALTFINCNGGVVWSQVYRDVITGQNLLGNDLIRAQTGNPAVGTNAGDLIVAGFWRDAVDEDAFLMRTTAAGAGPIWSNLYHVAREAFNALTEAAPLAGQITGDIVAVGRFNGGNAQGLAARVSGDNGGNTAAQHCMSHHGQAASAEVYNSVTPLTVGFPGQFAMVGATTAGGSNDIWITRGSPCVLAAQSRVGNAGGAATNEQGYDIRQVLVANAGGPAVGTLAIAGSHAIAALGGAMEAALLFVTPGPLLPVGGANRLFGDLAGDHEIFFSLAQNPAGGPHPPGYILAGLSQADWDGFGDPQDMYLVYYNPAVVGCAQIWNPTGVGLGWPQVPITPLRRTVVRPFPVGTPVQALTTPFLVCP